MPAYCKQVNWCRSVSLAHRVNELLYCSNVFKILVIHHVPFLGESTIITLCDSVKIICLLGQYLVTPLVLMCAHTGSSAYDHISFEIVIVLGIMVCNCSYLNSSPELVLLTT